VSPADRDDSVVSPRRINQGRARGGQTSLWKSLPQ